MTGSARLVWGLMTVGLAVSGGAWLAGAEPKTDAAALERTRKQVRMLDDIYKNVVVLVTDKYVHKETDFSAGSAAVALFAVMKKNGWHDARLVDATDQPFEEKNSPKDEFEKAAIKALKGGKAYYEQVVDIDGKPHLRAATIVPVVSQKCVMCHPHYADVKPGAAIGAVSYILKIE